MANIDLNFDGLTKLRDWWAVVKSNFFQINAELEDYVDQYEEHVAGTGAKHSASVIVDDSGITADQKSTNEKLQADRISGDDALDTKIEALSVTGSSDPLIAVYKSEDLTNVNNYVVDIPGLPIFEGQTIKLRLKYSNTEDSPTITYNSGLALEIIILKDELGESIVKAGRLRGNIIVSYNAAKVKWELIGVEAEAYSTIQSIANAIISAFLTGTLQSKLLADIGGLTIGNKVINNDFNSLIDWVAFGSTHSILDGILTNLADGSSATPSTYQANIMSVKAGDRVTVAMNSMNDNSDSIERYIQATDGTAFYLMGTVVNEANKYDINLGIIDILNDGILKIELKHKYPDAATANGNSMKIDGNFGVFAINNNQYGIESFTESQMLNIVKQMQAGTSLQNAIVNIKTLGKNLFNVLEPLIGATISAEGIVIPTPTAIVTKDGTQVTIETTSAFRGAVTEPIEVGSNETCYVSLDKIHGVDGTNPYFSGGARCYDKSENYLGTTGNIELTTGARTGGFFTTLPGTSDIRLALYNSTITTSIVKDIQIEYDRGQVLGIYKPYQENFFTPDTLLRSLPNGFRDRLYNCVVDPNDSNKLLALDKWVWEKKIEKNILVSEDIISIDTAYSNLDFAVIQLPLDCVNSALGDGKVVSDRYPLGGSPVDDNIDDIGRLLGYTSSLRRMAIGIPNGTSLATAQSDISGTEVEYLLQNIIVTELDLDEIYSLENGTLYQNYIPCQIDYTTAVNQVAVVQGLTETVENLDDKVVDIEDNLEAHKSDNTRHLPAVIGSEGQIPRVVGGVIVYDDESEPNVWEKIGATFTSDSTAQTHSFAIPAGYRMLKMFGVTGSATPEVKDLEIKFNGGGSGNISTAYYANGSRTSDHAVGQITLVDFLPDVSSGRVTFEMDIHSCGVTKYHKVSGSGMQSHTPYNDTTWNAYYDADDTDGITSIDLDITGAGDAGYFSATTNIEVWGIKA